MGFIVFLFVLLLGRMHTHTQTQELFISYLTQQTHKKCAHKKDLNYNDLSNFVQEEEKLEFLHQIVPKKITVKEFREILERGSESEDSDDDESESENSDDGEEVEEEEDESGSDASDDEEDGGEFKRFDLNSSFFIDLFSSLIFIANFRSGR